MAAVANWLRYQIGSVPAQAVVMLLLALGVSAGGFYRVVYFISLGYAFSISAMAVAGVLLFRSNLDALILFQSALLFLYGVRLGFYLIHRELQPAFQKTREDVKQRSAGVGIGLRIVIWVSVSTLYVLMFSPCLFGLASLSAARFARIAGIVIMAAGLGLEALADRQKSVFKSRHPGEFCNVGLYRWVRCPNYLGEIVFWVGNWVAGIPFYTSALRWVAASIGLVCIILIMMGSTKRLEKGQGERYGDSKEYREYIRTVPVLFPFIPVYTLQSIRVFLE